MIFFMVTGGEPEVSIQRLNIDEDLIVRIDRDDRSALEEFYTLTERTLYSYVLAIVKNPYDTQDIVQDTYLKVRASAHLYQKQGKPLAGLFTIARNLAMDLFRRNSRFLSEEAFEMDDTMEYSYVTEMTDRLVLETAMNILTERERQILLLHLVAGIRHREIAANLGLPLSTVLSCYQRTLKKLKRYLEGKE
ncbi:RNA polymerase sigma factor [Hungatella hathewayi]|uniref:RNA polymerase sigma factor n=1 Tax=Hungatella hathewayi TaxID=154046 RepID=UPI00242B23E2|nr:RNA polymerase sigma factor [Hungatella hathewayi]